MQTKRFYGIYLGFEPFKGGASSENLVDAPCLGEQCPETKGETEQNRKRPNLMK